MSKTITIRLNDEIYEQFKKAAEGERRNISNFIEYAALSWLTHESYVSDAEMKSILNNESLVSDIQQGLDDIKKGNYTIVD